MTEPPRPEPMRGQVLRVACPAPERKPASGEPGREDPAGLVRAYGQAWASRHSATLDVQQHDSTKELPATADVWVLRPAELSREAAAGRLLPLPESFTGHDTPFAWSDLLPDYRSPLLAWGQTTCAVPLAGEAPLCCYRLDRFSDREAAAAYRKRFGRDLAPPRTWEQFADIAEFFRDRDGQPSLPPLPADDRGLDRLFWTVAASCARRAVPIDEAAGETHLDDVFSFYYDLNKGTPRIDGPGFVYALELLQRLQACRPAKPVPVPEKAFLDGQGILCLTDACWLAEFQKKPALRDHVGLCAVPGARQYFTPAGEPRRVSDANRVPYLGSSGWLAVVPKTASHPEAAFDFLADLAGPQTSGQMILAPRWGTGPTREEQLRNDRWDAFDLDLPMTNRLRDVLQETLLHRSIKNPLVCLRTPTEAVHREALDAELRRALQEKGTSAAETLAMAARKWRDLDQKHGVDAHRAEYRLSLGLLSATPDRKP
jgi:multiple sugar transport system substrate-binding protein